MTLTIQPLTFSVCPFSFFSELQEKTSQLLSKINERLFPLQPSEMPERAVIDLGAIWRDPGQLVEGGIWGAWCAASVYFLTNSLNELYGLISVEDPGDRRFEKIVLAAKSVFVDLVSLGSSTLYTFRWADGAKIIALGVYLPLVRYLCYGTSLLVSAVETVFDAHQLRVEVQGLFEERGGFLFHRHLERTGHLAMKLVSNVSMIAWAALGIATLGGVVVHSALMPLLLTIGCVLGIAAVYYKMKISRDE